MNIEYKHVYSNTRFHLNYSKRWNEWCIGPTYGYNVYYFDNIDMRHLLFAIADYLGYEIPRKHVPKYFRHYKFDKYHNGQFMIGCKRFDRKHAREVFKVLLDHFDYEVV